MLKVANEAAADITLYGQEKDIATRGLSIMNMWLHGHPEASIEGKNTLAYPQFTEKDGSLKRFDFVVSNPPFSMKNWSTGIIPLDDEFNRFRGYGVPPEKNGDYAFLLHILASMKSTGKGAVILPHGVLFRGNAEASTRQNIIERKWIKGIIGLPANLFYGTGIPACIIVLDKEGTAERKGIFMIDASKGFMKDGNKNRLREQDIHKIVDVFNSQKELPKYARFVPFEEIKKNEYNLNIPRYIDTQEEEDIQDLSGHLNGGIPNRDIDNLQEYWKVYPSLKQDLLAPLREGYSELNVDKAAIKSCIFEHTEFKAYRRTLDGLFEEWNNQVSPQLNAIHAQTAPKQLIHQISEALLEIYEGKALVNAYDIYQHLLNYWNETMKDDVYLLVEDGWGAKVRRIIEKNKKGKEVDKGWTCDLIPKDLIVQAYLLQEQQALQNLEADLEAVQAEMRQYEEEHAGEGGLLEEATNDKGKITKTTLANQMKQVKNDPTEKEAYTLMQELKKLFDQEAILKKSIKTQVAKLDQKTLEQYGCLTEDEVKKLVVIDKWLATIQAAIQQEIDAISQRLTTRIKDLAERYGETLTALDAETKALEAKVAVHLQKMGLIWS